MGVLREHFMQILKTTDDYRNALTNVERLIDRKLRPGTPEAEELEVLTLLIKNYEDARLENFPPDPIEAIKFRMEQQNLSPRDLVPFIGSRSKVSEVLSRKRPLTLSMIRALHNGLGIPAVSLLQDQTSFEFEAPEFEWFRFPLDEMVERGWIEPKGPNWKLRAEEIMRAFFAPIGSPAGAVALYKQTKYVRCARPVDNYALTAWTARIKIKAMKSPPIGEYKPETVNLEFMREVVRLSTFDAGPKLAIEFLARHGISVVVEGHLLRTYLDGAATIVGQKQPVIGLTLRHDRIDNFWHTLIHELAHVALHFSKGTIAFYDDLDVGDQGDDREREADTMATEALVPRKEWRESPASRLRTPEAAKHLADKLKIHPAIVAGYIRHHWKSYRKLSHLVGHGLVRRLFSEVKWGEVK
jgi:HTH-type transcriptional regulator/antitoxin HigA